jgi:hypothetical protein
MLIKCYRQVVVGVKVKEWSGYRGPSSVLPRLQRTRVPGSFLIDIINGGVSKHARNLYSLCDMTAIQSI